MKYFITLIGVLFSYAAHADLIVESFDRYSLPTQYSPSYLYNSPSYLYNSPSYLYNSPSYLYNSPSYLYNSPSYLYNGNTGDKRLLLNTNSGLSRVGYYVITDDGLINFFSVKGKRMFYSPKDTPAIFQDSTGKFSGVIAPVGNDYKLLLNNYGVEVVYNSN